jgi:hypothetical protein
VVLKGPLATPLGGGGKSANVTLRKLFETYGNVRPVRELPGVATPFSGRGVDLVIVRENVEDLYAGIEHMQTPGVAQSLKLITRKGCEKIVRLAFELARAEGRPSVHCVTKSNILKLTEGMLQRTFEDVAREYPEIAAHHMLVDNCAMQLVMRPEQFSVLVTTNMNGDILSDLASGLVGGLGFAPSANLGADVAMFEAVHGTAPDIAGQDKANPDRAHPLRGADAPAPRRGPRGGGRGARAARGAGRGRAHGRPAGHDARARHHRLRRRRDRAARAAGGGLGAAGGPADADAAGERRRRLRRPDHPARARRGRVRRERARRGVARAHAGGDGRGHVHAARHGEQPRHAALPVERRPHRHRGPLALAASCSATPRTCSTTSGSSAC